MAIGKILGVGSILLFVAGCQSWQYRDLDEYPSPAAIPTTSEQGKVIARYWNNVAGTSVDNLTQLAVYPDEPDELVELSSLSGPANRGSSYGTLVRGYIVPPATGTYHFYVSGDDQTQLFLSSSSDPLDLSLVASVTGWTAQGQYDKYASQDSGPIPIVGGTKYYFEIRHKEASGGDHFSVAWEGPGLTQQVVQGQYLYSFAKSIYPTDDASREAYSLGYRVGYLDGQTGLDYNLSYPPLDEDQDYLYDNWEVQYGLNPNLASDAQSDADEDFLTALDEFEIGTEPNTRDSDGDGLPDGYEYAYELDPLDPGDANVDLDNDGFTILQEYEAGTDPLDPNDTPQAEPTYVPGFTAQYFSGTEFNEFLLVRTEQQVDHNWGGGSPAEVVPANYFSARWTGWFTPPTTGSYQFGVRTDDGARLYVGGERVIDQWVPRGPTLDTVTVDLAQNVPVVIEMEYFERASGALAQLTIFDMQTATLLSQPDFVEAYDLADTHDVSTLDDGIPDLYKLRHGLPISQPVASLAFNPEGVTVMEAYKQNLHPYTLEPIAEPTSPEPEATEPAAPEGAITLSWTAPGTRVDGSSIALSEISHYIVNYGQDPNNLNQTQRVEPDQTSYTFSGLASGSWYFNIEVVDTSGLVSEPSNTVDYLVP